MSAKLSGSPCPFLASRFWSTRQARSNTLIRFQSQTCAKPVGVNVAKGAQAGHGSVLHHGAMPLTDEVEQPDEQARLRTLVRQIDRSVAEQL